MDSELVSDSESVGGREKREHDPRSRSFAYADKFEELCPYYLSMGMTYEQYWYGDSTMVRDYRKAYELKTEVHNQEMWMQAVYIYEAICDVLPALNAFKPKKPLPFRSEPYGLQKHKAEEPDKARQEKSDDKAKAYLQMFAAAFNKKLRKEDVADAEC